MNVPSYAFRLLILVSLILSGLALQAQNPDPKPSPTEAIEQGAEKLFNGLFGTEKEEADETEEQDVSVTVEEDDRDRVVEPSEFIGSFTLETQTTKNGRPDRDGPSRVTYYIDEYRFAVAPEAEEGEGQSFMIYDRQEREVITKTISKKGERSASITPMLRIKIGVEDRSVREGEFSVEPTGRSKTIEGHTCQEYRVETEDDLAMVWVAPAIPLDWRVLADFMQVKGVGGAAQASNLYGLEGVVLEAHLAEKGKDVVTDYYLRDLQQGSVPTEVFSLEGYEVSDLGSIFGK